MALVATPDVAICVATFDPTNVNWSAVLYAPTAAPLPPVGFDPTAGVVFVLRLMPNPAVPGTDGELEYEASAVPPAGLRAFGELYVIEYPLAALVEATSVDVPVLAAAVVIELGERLTVAAPRVKVNASSTVALTVITPAVEAATTPVSIGVVHAASEYVVMRRKNVLLAALGFTTLSRVMVAPALGAPVLLAFKTRSFVVVATLDVHTPPDPRPVGAVPIVPAPALEKPAALAACVHVPLAVSQA